MHGKVLEARIEGLQVTIADIMEKLTADRAKASLAPQGGVKCAPSDVPAAHEDRTAVGAQTSALLEAASIPNLQNAVAELKEQIKAECVFVRKSLQSLQTESLPEKERLSLERRMAAVRTEVSVAVGDLRRELVSRGILPMQNPNGKRDFHAEVRRRPVTGEEAKDLQEAPAESNQPRTRHLTLPHGTEEQQIKVQVANSRETSRKSSPTSAASSPPNTRQSANRRKTMPAAVAMHEPARSGDVPQKSHSAQVLKLSGEESQPPGSENLDHGAELSEELGAGSPSEDVDAAVHGGAISTDRPNSTNADQDKRDQVSKFQLDEALRHQVLQSFTRLEASALSQAETFDKDVSPPTAPEMSANLDQTAVPKLVDGQDSNLQAITTNSPDRTAEPQVKEDNLRQANLMTPRLDQAPEPVVKSKSHPRVRLISAGEEIEIEIESNPEMQSVADKAKMKSVSNLTSDHGSPAKPSGITMEEEVCLLNARMRTAVDVIAVHKVDSEEKLNSIESQLQMLSSGVLHRLDAVEQDVARSKSPSLVGMEASPQKQARTRSRSPNSTISPEKRSEELGDKDGVITLKDDEKLLMAKAMVVLEKKLENFVSVDDFDHLRERVEGGFTNIGEKIQSSRDSQMQSAEAMLGKIMESRRSGSRSSRRLSTSPRSPRSLSRFKARKAYYEQNDSLMRSVFQMWTKGEAAPCISDLGDVVSEAMDRKLSLPGVRIVNTESSASAEKTF
jgi:hypothetical protein